MLQADGRPAAAVRRLAVDVPAAVRRLAAALAAEGRWGPEAPQSGGMFAAPLIRALSEQPGREEIMRSKLLESALKPTQTEPMLEP